MKNKAVFGYIIAIFIGIFAGGLITSIIARYSNDQWLIRPALKAKDPDLIRSEYLLLCKNWAVPVKITEENNELRIALIADKSKPTSGTLHIWVDQSGVRSLTVANSTRNGATIARNNKTGLLDDLAIQTVSPTSQNKIIMKKDHGLDGTFDGEQTSN